MRMLALLDGSGPWCACCAPKQQRKKARRRQRHRENRAWRRDPDHA